jgi:hypothetical protein
LKELVSLHGEHDPDQEAGDLMGGELGATLTKDEVTIIKGALDLSSKVVKDAMTPIDKVFMLDTKDRLTQQRLDQVPNMLSPCLAPVVCCNPDTRNVSFSSTSTDSTIRAQPRACVPRRQSQRHRHDHRQEAHQAEP